MANQFTVKVLYVDGTDTLTVTKDCAIDALLTALEQVRSMQMMKGPYRHVISAVIAGGQDR